MLQSLVTDAARAKLKKEAEQWDARGSTGLPGYILKPSIKNEEIGLISDPSVLDEQRSQRGCRFLEVTSSQGAGPAAAEVTSSQGAGPAAAEVTSSQGVGPAAEEPGGGHL